MYISDDDTDDDLRAMIADLEDQRTNFRDVDPGHLEQLDWDLDDLRQALNQRTENRP